MSKNEPKFKIGQAVVIKKEDNPSENVMEAYIVDSKQYSDGGYHYELMKYNYDGSIGRRSDFPEARILPDEAREYLQDITGLLKDFHRSFEIGDSVIVDTTEPRRSVFFDHRSVFRRGTVTGIFLDAAAGQSFWDKVKVNVKETDRRGVRAWPLAQIQSDWANPGKPEILAPKV